MKNIKNILSDQGITVLILAGLNILLTFVVRDLQSKLGWLVLSCSLISIIFIFLIVILIIQKPIQQTLYQYLEELKNRVDPTSISWLLDTTQLIDFELNSKAKEIWLFSSDLLDDDQGGPFFEVVKKKISYGTKYVYFVPDSPQVKARTARIIENYRKDSSKTPQVIYLPDSFFFLVPKLDIVIYNPLSPKSGLLGRCAFMGVPSHSSENVHYHVKVSLEFIDKIVGIVLPIYKKPSS